MFVMNLFSKRKKNKENIGKPDVYKYDDLPEPLRNQIILIWLTAIGHYRPIRQFDEPPISNAAWTYIYNTLKRELGVLSLTESSSANLCDQCVNFFLHANLDHALDIIELTFQVIEKHISKMEPYDLSSSRITQNADDAISELNERFKEHSIGYRYTNGEIVQINSEFVHSEIIQPALSLLHSQRFKGAEDEFLKAHEHYRAKRNKEAISEALKAFESTLKTICHTRSWAPNNNLKELDKANAQQLIKCVFDNGLIPSEMESHFTALRSVMESGLPTLRNRNSGHGQGAIPVQIPDYMASYALHLAATNIVFLVEAHNSKP